MDDAHRPIVAGLASTTLLRSLILLRDERILLPSSAVVLGGVPTRREEAGSSSYGYVWPGISGLNSYLHFKRQMFCGRHQ